MQPPSRSTSTSPGRVADTTGASQNVPSAPQRQEIPGTYLSIEPPPLSVYNDNPIFDARGAAAILGVSVECLKKWRQRDQGPSYVQYGRGGPVRYELDTLLAFRAAHTVQVSPKR